MDPIQGCLQVKYSSKNFQKEFNGSSALYNSEEGKENIAFLRQNRAYSDQKHFAQFDSKKSLNKVLSNKQSAKPSQFMMQRKQSDNSDNLS